ncbi:caspase family protein [Streptomyces caatingaensis]|uniref:caspase family protein n=1 Tax=Streptomyces caatingaensis TaxID=1678637 RepID=UPI00067285BC|nr:caspase family protein [Streptomyces caatingaensis]
MNRIPEPGLSRAVLIGVSTYTHLDDLPGVANNLPALAEVVCGPSGWGLDTEHCTVVAEPTCLEQMLEPVSAAARAARDTLFVYFAGHGLLNQQQELHLGLPDSRPGLGRTAVPYAWLREAIGEGRADRHVIVLDCCFSGRALGSMSGPDALADQAWIDGSFLMAAAPETGVALAPPGERFTAFTGELLATLENGVPGGDPWLTLDDLYLHLRSVLAARNRPVPQRRARNRAGELVWGRNAAYRPPVAQPPSPPGSAPGWPEPDLFLDTTDFLHGLALARAISGRTQRELSERASGPLSAGSISRLLNRADLPRRWTTVETYLAACGIPAADMARWKAAWSRLKTVPAPRPAPPKSTRGRFKALLRAQPRKKGPAAARANTDGQP